MRLQLNGLAKSFGVEQVLADVTLDADVEGLAVIGPSGGGKSTLLRIIAGLVSPDRGEVRLGEETLPRTPEALRRYRSHHGFVFQSHGLFSHLTGEANLTLPLIHVHGWSRQRAGARAGELLERFSLAGERQKYPHQMSGGQQQRMAIARAVAAEPSWLFLDEPTSALDPEYTSEVLDMLLGLRKEGLRCVVVTHHMGFARRACDHVAFLHGGRLAESGATAEVMDRPTTPELRQFLNKVLAW